jgi:hypothetical protein
MIRNINNIKKNFTNPATGSAYVIYGVTGFTGEFVFSRILIPANTFINGDVITVEGIFECSGSSSVKMYVGSGLTPSTSTQISTTTFGTSQQFITHSRTLHIVRANGVMTGTSPDRGTIVPSTGTSLVNEFESTPTSILSIDWTQDRYVFFTGTLLSTPAGRYINQYSMKIWTY